jgi:hypothetical protein
MGLVATTTAVIPVLGEAVTSLHLRVIRSLEDAVFGVKNGGKRILALLH